MKTDSTKTGRDYLDELDFWAEKELNARLALQKAEWYLRRCVSCCVGTTATVNALVA